MRNCTWMQNIGGIATVGLLLIYKMVMDVFYVDYAFPLYKYMHYTANPNTEDAITAWWIYAGILFLFRPVLWKPVVSWTFSEFVLFVLLLFSVVPGLSMCGAGAFQKEYSMWFYLYWLCFFVLASIFSKIRFRLSGLLGGFSLKDKSVFLYSIGMIVAVTVVCVFLGYNGKLFFSNLLSQNVYSVRANWGSINMPIVMSYIMANASVILLFLMMCFLEKKRYPEALFLLVVEFMLFSCSASKSVLLSAAICIAVYVLHKWLYPFMIILPLIGIMFWGMNVYDASDDVSIIALFSRSPFTTNFLSSCYWDYFRTHIPVWDIFSEFPTESKNAMPLLIGNLYVAQNTYANNGLLGSAFMMVGRYGVIFSPVVWNMYLHILDKAGNHVASWIKLSMSISWAVTMMNSAMTTSMLSHGGVALLVLGYLSKGVVKRNRMKGLDERRFSY